MTAKRFDPTRRSFLVAVGAAPAVGLAVLAGTRPESAPPVTAGHTFEQSGSGSYHVTDHIRKYYYTAGFF